MKPHQSHGIAWIALSLALAVHVADEALNDFLSVYNPTVEAIRRRLPYLPLPVFTFEAWLTGLIVAVVALLALSPLVFRGTRWMIPASYIFSAIMLFNGLGHCAGSIYMGTAMAGVYSSPLLIAASLYLLVTTHRALTVAAR